MINAAESTKEGKFPSIHGKKAQIQQLFGEMFHFLNDDDFMHF